MNPIFYSDGTLKMVEFSGEETLLEKGWYYWCETWADWSGPFDTEQEAEIQLKEYVKFLDSEPKVKV